MRNTLTTIINDYYEKLPLPLTVRDAVFPVLARKATVVIGMRRTGKTYRCFQEIQRLQKSGIAAERILYLNFDDERLLDFTPADFQMILDLFYARCPANKERLCYFFFDEIQNIPHWETFIRRLIDTENVQITITGSSAKLLSTEIATTLRGRTLTCEVFPFSFKEYLLTHKIFNKIPEQLSSTALAKIRHAIKDYFYIGGFPEVQTLDNFTRQQILQSYLETVIFKDVVERHQVTNVLVLRHLIVSGINNVAQKFSVSKFFGMLQNKGIACTKNLLYAYLDHFVDAYLFYPVGLHTDKLRVKQVNPHKLYVVDVGLQRALSLTPEKNYGHLLENLVYQHLRRQNCQIEYLQTPEKYEVDFFVRHYGSGKQQLIQVAYDLSDEATLVRELRALAITGKRFKHAEQLVITWDDARTFAHKVRTVPIWNFLLE